MKKKKRKTKKRRKNNNFRDTILVLLWIIGFLLFKNHGNNYIPETIYVGTSYIMLLIIIGKKYGKKAFFH